MTTTTYSPHHIAATVLHLLRPHLADPAQPSFWLWALPDRAVISVNPGNIRNIDALLSDRFVHHLSTTLGGVRVQKTNTRGIFYQVGYSPTPPRHKPTTQPLDLTQQPSPTHVPIGDTTAGPLWLDLLKLDAVLIGGARRMGKTRVLHGFIQALQNGGACRLYLWDGKSGNEFNRYAGGSAISIIPPDGLDATLSVVRAEADRRATLFAQVGAVSLSEYNALPAVTPLPPLVLILDEVADLTNAQAETLTQLTRQAGAYGVHPVIGIQRPDANAIPGQLRANLVTRIAMPVAKGEDSRIILGAGGAEKLPKEPGHLLIYHSANLITARAFAVELPAIKVNHLLTRDELSLACRAQAETSNRLSIPILVHWGMSEHHARTLLDDWQTRGLIVPSTQNPRCRHLSPRVLDAISQTPQTITNHHKPPQTTSNPVSAETEEKGEG